MNRLLRVAILAICTVPLYAQTQPPNAAELAQTVFGIIAGDKTKSQFLRGLTVMSRLTC